MALISASVRLTKDRPRYNQERSTLVGSQCSACRTLSWPARAVCNRCGSPDVGIADLPQVGSLLSYTRVWVARQGMNIPYVLGQIRLGPGALLFAHVRGLDEGAIVPIDVRVVVPADNEPADVAFWFEPADTGTEGAVAFEPTAADDG
jgi:uncharacterized OB-fold protein